MMKANVSKTKIMLLGTPHKTRQRNLKVHLNNDIIENVHSFKYLGITIDANLKWKIHIDTVYRKVCSSIAIMRRIKPFVPKGSLITIYNTMILPHIDYAIITWSHCGETNLNRLQRLQNMAMRVILSAPFRTHIDDMLRELGFMSIRDRIVYNTGCMMFKVIHDLTPMYLKNQFVQLNEVHGLNTRGSASGKLYIPKYSSNYGKASFQHKGSVMWNAISRDIREVNTLIDFKMKLKKDLRL